MRHPLLAAAHWPLGSPEPPEIVPRGDREFRSRVSHSYEFCLK